MKFFQITQNTLLQGYEKKIIEFTKNWKRRNLLNVVEISYEWYISAKEAEFLDENEYEIVQINIEYLNN